MIVLAALALLLATAVVVALHWFGTVAAAQAQEAERLAAEAARLTQWATALAAHESGRCHSTAECVRTSARLFPIDREVS